MVCLTDRLRDRRDVGSRPGERTTRESAAFALKYLPLDRIPEPELRAKLPAGFGLRPSPAQTTERGESTRSVTTSVDELVRVGVMNADYSESDVSGGSTSTGRAKRGPFRMAARRSSSSRGSVLPPQPRTKSNIPVDIESSSTS